MPELGSSMTLYVRETTVIQDTFTDFLYRLFSPSDIGVGELRQTVSKILHNHEPNTKAKLKSQSVFVYLRQDPFKATVYVGYKTGLLMFA